MEEVTNEEQEEQVVNEEEVASESGAASETAEESQEEAMDEEALSLVDLDRGDVVEGVVVQVNDDNVLVDIGYKSDGVIPRSELNLANEQSAKELLDEGDRIYVYVLTIDGKDGGVLLSKRRADEEISWRALQEKMDSNEIIEGHVVEEVKGGLVINVGVRGFMPASHVDRGYVSDLGQFVGQTVRARVIELDRSKNRVILSRKSVLEEEYAEQREETWNELQEGQVRTGVVKGITNFGAFIDLGGVDGLLHVSEMSWGRVDHPSDVVSEGDEIEVKVLKVNREEEKISLGLKQLQPNPWDNVADKYDVGSVVEGKVMRLAPFGAFVQLEPGVEGLVHISQLAHHHVQKPDEVVSEGDVINVKVLRVQPQERRISLSLKETTEPKQAPPQPRFVSRDNRGEGVTLGEVFGDLLEETKERLNNDAAEAEAEAAGQAEVVDDVEGLEDSADDDEEEKS